MSETYLDYEFCWYVKADIYDVDDMTQRIAFVNTVMTTYEPVIPPEEFEEIIYEQVKAPFIKNLPPEQLGCAEGYVFDITAISYLGQNYFEVEEEFIEDIEQL